MQNTKVKIRLQSIKILQPYPLWYVSPTSWVKQRQTTATDVNSPGVIKYYIWVHCFLVPTQPGYVAQAQYHASGHVSFIIVLIAEMYQQKLQTSNPKIG